MLRRGMMAQAASGGGNTDDFSTNTIASYTQYANSPTTWTITGGALTCNSGSGSKQSVLTRNGVSFANGEISCVITVADDAGLALRLQNNSNYYVAVISDASAAIGAANQNKVKLFKRVGGTFTQLGTAQTIAFTRGTSHTFSFSAVGNLLTVKFDGSTLISVTDSSLAAAGRCGPRSDSFQASFDSFTWP